MRGIVVQRQVGATKHGNENRKYDLLSPAHVAAGGAFGDKKREPKFLGVLTFCILELKMLPMIIEKTKDQILIKISPKVDAFGFQRIMDYLEYLEVASKSKAKQSEADKLANELNQTWWENNKSSFIQ